MEPSTPSRQGFVSGPSMATSTVVPENIAQAPSVTSTSVPQPSEASQAPAVSDASIAEQVKAEMALPMERTLKYENELDYSNKLVLAPMVRSGSCEYDPSLNTRLQLLTSDHGPVL
jgi:hypothetical protein